MGHSTTAAGFGKIAGESTLRLLVDILPDRHHLRDRRVSTRAAVFSIVKCAVNCAANSSTRTDGYAACQRKYSGAVGVSIGVDTTRCVLKVF